MRNLLLLLALTTLANAIPGPTELLRNGSLQASPMPKADKQGEYEPGARSHHFWLVISKDGLNGRAALPDTTGQRFADRPIVRFFPEGTVLTGTSQPETQTGMTGLFDNENKLWIRVLDGDLQKPGYCMVRCNARWLVPLRISEK